MIKLLNLLLIAVTFTACQTKTEPKQNPSNTASSTYQGNVSLLVKSGTRAADGIPDFSWHDAAGKEVSFTEFSKGKPVLINFWATWCKPCTTEMPAMQATYDRLRGKGFVVLAVNELEDDEKVRAHIREYKHTFPVLMDRENRVANLYGVYGLPVSVFIDEAGVVQAYIKGGLLTEQKIEDEIARIRSAKLIQAAAR